MKHVQLFEQFINEARDSTIKAWSMDYFKARKELSIWSAAFEDQTVELDFMKTIDSPNEKLVKMMAHIEKNLKKVKAAMKKWDKKSSALESEFEEIKDTSKDADILKKMAFDAGSAVHNLEHFHDSKIGQYEKTYEVEADDLDALKKIIKDYDASYYKEFEKGEKLVADFKKYHSTTK